MPTYVTQQPLMAHFSIRFFQDVALFCELKSPNPQVGKSYHCGQGSMGIIIIWAITGGRGVLCVCLRGYRFSFSAVLFEHKMARNPEDSKTVWETNSQN